MNTDPLRSYRETQIKTAGQGTLIVMLYDEAIKQIRQAEEAIGDRQAIERTSNSILKAQDIVTELSAALDFERGGDLARRLFSIYLYVKRQLLEANIHKQVEPLRAERLLLTELRDSWSEIARRPGDSNGGSGSGVNIAG